ncbi:hypothetical protein, partial [Pseudonocardia zijingensis]|uniref:hypothetical protein n=1 Tax=Pseudonocardia zijingensis TaxID=153376 RepID=UPI0031E18B38
ARRAARGGRRATGIVTGTTCGADTTCATGGGVKGMITVLARYRAFSTRECASFLITGVATPEIAPERIDQGEKVAG